MASTVFGQPQLSPQDFWDECQRFDWFYDYSDDARVWRRGTAETARLLAHAPEGSVNRRIWGQWRDHVFSGPSFGKPKAARPERPS